MADSKDIVNTQFNQVLKNTDPQGTLEQLRAASMDPKKYGSCSPKHDFRSIPEEERSRGCTEWKNCTLQKIKGKAGPVNLPYRLYKKGGVVREGWGPCFAVFRMAGQYNLGNDNYIMEILPLNSTVDVRGSKPRLNAVGVETGVWDDFVETQKVPPFPKIGERGHLILEQQATKVRKELTARRRQQMIDTTMGIGPEDVEAANEAGSGKAG